MINPWRSISSALELLNAMNTLSNLGLHWITQNIPYVFICIPYVSVLCRYCLFKACRLERELWRSGNARTFFKVRVAQARALLPLSFILVRKLGWCKAQACFSSFWAPEQVASGRSPSSSPRGQTSQSWTHESSRFHNSCPQPGAGAVRGQASVPQC